MDMISIIYTCLDELLNAFEAIIFFFHQTLEHSSKLADSNFEKLKRESERLEELTQRSCSWWIWIMLITVCVVFMCMIMFIRLFPKK